MKAVLRAARSDRDGAVLLATWLVLYLVLALVLGGRFFSVPNLQSMAIQVSSLGMLALAMSLAMLSGGIDLSIVSTAALSSIVGAFVMSGRWIGVSDGNEGMITALGVLAVLLTALLCGIVNGVLIARFSVPPILATLATMIFYSGVALAMTNGQSIAVATATLSTLSTATFAYVPFPFLVMVVAYVVLGFVLARRRLGRRLYLIGESVTALRFSGARTERVTLAVYTGSGLLAGFAAMLMLASQNTAREGFGESYLLQAILVAVLAGFNPDGGSGRVRNLAIAVVVLQSLQSAFSILGFSPFAKNFVWGAALLVIMVMSYFARRDRRKVATPSAGPELPVVTSPVPAER